MTGTVLAAYTAAHVALSLVGIVTGLIVAYGLLRNNAMSGMTKVFLWTTVLTSVTGYGFPVHQLMPSHVVGAISLLVLGLAIVARYSRELASGWRRTYVIGAMLGLYLNCFVLVVQLFEKVPALKALAPTQKEAPFAIAQFALLIAFVALTAVAVKRFRGQLRAVSRSHTARAA